MNIGQQISEIKKYIIIQKSTFDTMNDITRFTTITFHMDIMHTVENNSDEKIVNYIYELLINNKTYNDINYNLIYYYYGTYFKIKNDETNMLKYYKLAAELNNVNAQCELATYYQINQDTDNMIIYNKMAIELGDAHSMVKLAVHYKNINHYDKMMEYYDMAIKKGYVLAMCDLARYYRKQQKYDDMMRYNMMAIELGDCESMCELADYYNSINKYDDMLKYYNMAIDLKYVNAMCYLGLYYNRQHKYDEMVHYYKMAVDLNSDTAITALIVHYCAQFNFDELIKYCVIGHNREFYYFEYISFYCGENGRNTFALKLFIELYKQNIKRTEAIEYIKECCTDTDTLTAFISSHIDAHTLIEHKDEFIASQNDVIKTRDEYIDELELLPEGRQYKAVKKHFDTSVEQLSNGNDDNDIEKIE
ncbi:MAG: hypothetical protein Faunusvirus6_24 [Faunusvirus sp.]|jgi:TPR repeat protein|uniref:Uncharacterized protein n=1 Tax=Faunusvirus sp. TaxID=2487766 RepID=A0A3G4ZWH5_9VIRU|nr:MAG: hypothetical protein Faunusvirus6_24 [Faunusvirus sp.]